MEILRLTVPLVVAEILRGDIAIHSSATDSERESQAIHQSGSDGQATSPMDRRHHRED